MVFTNAGLSGTALLWGLSGTTPGFLAIGSGSGVATADTDTLIFEFPDTRKAFITTNIATQQQITWVTDFNSITMSGLTLRELGVSAESSGGKLWNRENFGGVVFDGTQELIVDVVYKTST